MKIETILEKGDKAWFMFRNKPRQSTIKGITINYDSQKFNHLLVIKYFFITEEEGEISLDGSEIFISKQDLLESL